MFDSFPLLSSRQKPGCFPCCLEESHRSSRPRAATQKGLLARLVRVSHFRTGLQWEVRWTLEHAGLDSTGQLKTSSGSSSEPS